MCRRGGGKGRDEGEERRRLRVGGIRKAWSWENWFSFFVSFLLLYSKTVQDFKCSG